LLGSVRDNSVGQSGARISRRIIDSGVPMAEPSKSPPKREHKFDFLYFIVVLLAVLAIGGSQAHASRL
jgi:hypothetical protein